MYRHSKSYGATLPDDHVVEPHMLCRYCSEMCLASSILRDVPRKYLESGDDTLISSLESDEESQEDLLHGTIAELEASLMAGCHLCSQIYARITPSDLKNLHMEHQTIPGSRLKFSIEASTSIRTCMLRMRINQDKTGGCCIPVYAASDRRLPQPNIISPGQLTMSTKSWGSFSLSQSWLSSCQKCHSTCSSFFNGAEVPTRLIDVSGAEPFLCITSSANVTKQRYLTLSHSWGGNSANILRLLTSNLEDLKKSIPLGALPQTIVDALYITRMLSYQYLWIDSLCIIQDSTDDWAIEAHKMADIYGGSDCTIAALGRDGHVGCFRRRNPLTRRPCRLIEANGSAVYVHGFTVRDTPEHSERFLEDEAGFPSVSNLPLLRRAWVVQERLLSKRVLYFGQDGLLWECFTGSASEFHPEIWAQTDEYTPVKVSLANALLADRDSILYNTRLAKSWNSILEAYTQASLTFASDRIVALQGIINMVNVHTRVSFFAGILDGTLPDSLLWGCSRRIDAHIDDFQFSVSREWPTWSWRGLDQPITPHKVDFLLLSETGRMKNAVVTYKARCEPGGFLANSRKYHLPLNIQYVPGQAELKITSLLKKLHFKVYLDADATENPFYHRINHNFLSYGFIQADVTITDAMEPYLLLIRRGECQIEELPARSATPIWDTEIEEEGLVVIRYPPSISWENGWARIGRFHNIHMLRWPETSDLIFDDDDEERTVNLY